MNSRCLLVILLFSYLSGFSQNDVVIGTAYKLALQRQNGHGDAWILHNAYYHTGEDGLKYSSTNASGFGTRGIRFAYGSAKGIYFYASGENTTADATLTPTPRMFIGNTGNVGIGTTAPAGRLSVYGSVYIGNENASAEYRVSIGGSGGDYGSIGYGYRYTTTANLYNHAVSDKASQLLFHDGGFVFRTSPTGSLGNPVSFSSRMKIWEGGTVGIGTETLDSNYKLIVNGKIRAEEVQVVVDVPADYVFAPTYNLMPLSEVAKYIKVNRHLPNIPSADEIVQNGWQVGEMNNKLLEKVEEVTLYLIQLKEENEALKQKLEEIEIKLNNK